jgi:hypothetical protein
MGTVLRFPTAASPGLVRCRQLNVAFPSLYRVHVRTTAEQLALHLAKSGRVAEFADSAQESTYYTLDPIVGNPIGNVVQTEVTHVNAADMPESLLARYHPNYESASIYLSALCDLEFDDTREDPDLRSQLFETSEGIFTLIKRPTPKSADGPLFIHMADVPLRTASPCATDTQWTRIISHEGRELNPAEFGYADMR